MKTILTGGTVVSSHGRRQLDVVVEGEKIKALGHGFDDKDAQVVDVTGCYLFPGFIDGHTHLELNNGATDTSDNFTTGSIAAVCKGTTTVIDMATPERGHTLKECLAVWDKMTEGKSSCDYNYHMSLIEFNESLAEEIREMARRGVTSFKMYMAYDNLRTSDRDIYRAMLAIKEVGGMLGIHCENGDIINELQAEFLKEGKTAPRYHPLSRPNILEAEAVNRYLTIARQAGLAVNIVHLSTKESLEVAKRAREAGQELFIETCPQYLLLDDHLYDLANFEGAKYVCAPPLRSLEDQQALWQGVSDGDVDTIATDHCDFNFQTQKVMGKDDFTKIPGGLPGVETRPELIYTAGVTTGKITLERFVGLLSENIAKQFHLYPQKGVLQVGSDADIVVWDPEARGVIQAETQLQNCDYSAFEGFETKGAAKAVYLRGKLVSENGELLKGQQGKFIFRRIPEKK
ncbi:dihydropyrimidinase [Vagococcus elongatus]|uniref:Dihydropyrimidinase n=1 Tax=Vagococcus elongatus TaxID=180344 RepID=A0A430AMN5_9ENTE|nr:dihydropyrimidinase [Vagococcus elongatus]RSU09359.1 dihydropyrimidinase [Vagococcus elongatus]